MINFLFVLYKKNEFFKLTEGVPPTNGVGELWKKLVCNKN